MVLDACSNSSSIAFHTSFRSDLCIYVLLGYSHHWVGITCPALIGQFTLFLWFSSIWALTFSNAVKHRRNKQVHTLCAEPLYECVCVDVSYPWHASAAWMTPVAPHSTQQLNINIVDILVTSPKETLIHNYWQLLAITTDYDLMPALVLVVSMDVYLNENENDRKKGDMLLCICAHWHVRVRLEWSVNMLSLGRSLNITLFIHHHLLWGPY